MSKGIQLYPDDDNDSFYDLTPAKFNVLMENWHKLYNKFGNDAPLAFDHLVNELDKEV